MINKQQGTNSNKNTHLTHSRHKSFSMIIVFMFALVFFSGCSGLLSQKSGQHSISSSLAIFLNSGSKSKEIQKSGIAQLRLPVKVGIAFLPSQNWRGSVISESSKYQLLNKVKNSFGQHRFIETYL